MTASSAAAVDYAALREMMLAEPALVLGDPAFLTALFETKDEDNVVDLQSIARTRLQKEIRRLKKANETMIEMAKANLLAQGRAHNAALAIMDTHTFADLDKALGGRVARALGVDVVRVYLEGHSPLPSAECIRGAAPDLSSALLGPYAERLGPIEMRHAAALYGPRGQKMECEAVVPIEIAGHKGVLCLASVDSTLFTPDQGADLVHFVARAVETKMAPFMRDA